MAYKIDRDIKLPIVKKEQCKCHGCEEPSFKYGWCFKHLEEKSNFAREREWNWKHALLCECEVCGEEAYSAGLCYRHYIEQEACL